MSNNFYSDEEESKLKNDGSFNALLSTMPMYPFAPPASKIPSNMSVEPDLGIPEEPKDIDFGKILASVEPQQLELPASPRKVQVAAKQPLPKSAIPSFDIPKVGEAKKPALDSSTPGIPSNPVLPKRSIVDEYGDLAKAQDETIKGTQDSADTGNMIANILKGLSGVANADTISRGGKGYDVSNFDKVVDANNARVKNAQAGKAAALEELLKKNNLGRQLVDDDRASKRFDREQVENKYRDVNFNNSLEDRTINNSRASARFNQELKDNGFKNNANQSSAESIDPNSAISKQAVLTGKAVLISKAKEAASAGDKQASELLLNQANQLEGLSAAKVNDLINMNKSLDYKDVLNRNHQDAMSAAAEKKASSKEQNERFHNEDKIRSRIQALPAYKNYQEIAQKTSQLKNLMQTPTGPKDEAFVVSFQKSIDPGSVVREGEFSRTAQGQPLVDRWEAAMNQLRTGRRLTPELRQEIYEATAALHQGAKDYLMGQALAPYESSIVDHKLNRDNILEPELRGETSTKPETAPQGQKSGVQIKSVKDLPPI